MNKAHQPHDPDKCWGVPTTFHGYCLRKARKGKLTCKQHDNCERAAQILKGKQEQEKAFLELQRPEPHRDITDCPPAVREIASEFGIKPPPESVPKGPTI